MPGIVPLGFSSVASIAQGNAKGIASVLMARIVAGERDASLKKMTYPQIHRKYPNWGLGVDRLRGLDRETRLPKEDRSRKTIWTLPAVNQFTDNSLLHSRYYSTNIDFAQISALRTGVALNTGRKGKISWKDIKAHIVLSTGRVYGLLQIQAKWDHMQRLSQFSMAVLDPVAPVKLIRQRRGATGEN